MLNHLSSLKMACVLLLLFLLASAVADPDDIGQGTEGNEPETPPEEIADALVDPQIVAVEGHGRDPEDSVLLKQLDDAESEVHEIASQVISNRLQRIADDNNIPPEEASQELEHVLWREWSGVQEELVSHLWRNYSLIVGDMTAMDIAALSKEYLVAEKRLKALEGREGFCLVKYQGKCFWIDFHYDVEITCGVAGHICKSNGGRLANIYSEEHLEILQGYVRTLMVRQNENPNPAVSSWTGMRYSDETEATLLSDGSPAPYTSWREGYPIAVHDHCVSVQTTLRWSDLDQGYSNHALSDSAESVICEISV